MMDLSFLKALTVPAGAVKRILRQGVEIWRKNVLQFTLSADGSSYRCAGLREGESATEVVIPGRHQGKPVKEVAASAFYQHGKITAVTIREGVETIGNDAFREVSGAAKLVSLKLPESLVSIGDGTFRYCAKLALAELPEKITTILDQAFYGCSQVTFTRLPAGLTRLYAQCFRGCSKMPLEAIPTGVTVIETQVFYGCTKLAIREIPAKVTSIASSAFYNCTGLTEITFRGTPNTINPKAFDGCANLTHIYVPWAEGAVADAPWGATNAQIHYGSGGN